jgi:F-type H+-transporting ATPase subunit delta
MSLQIVAKRYAQAVLELAVAQGQLDKVVGDLTTVADAWSTSAELRHAIENPLVAHGLKKAVVAELVDQIGASPITRNALLLMVDRRRMRALPYVAQWLRELADARRGLVRAEVTSAAPLSDAYYARLQTHLERATGQKVAIDRRTDPALIGGVVTRIGGRIFDGSLRTRLQSVRDALLPVA